MAAAAPLLGRNGEIVTGHPGSEFSVQGPGAQNPATIAGQFAAYDSNLNGPPAALPPQPPAAAPQAPASPQPPQAPQAAAQEPETPPTADPLAGAPPETPAAEQGISTSEDLAKVFEGVEGADDLFGAITHQVGDQTFTVKEAIDGFLAQPAAAQVAQQRDTLQIEFAHRATELKANHDAAMKNLASQTTALKAMIEQDESPAKLAELLASDPVGFQAKQMEIEARKLALSGAEAEQARLADQQRRDDETRVHSYRAEQTQQLQTHFPEWFDAEKGPVVKQKLDAYARSRGFTDADLSGIDDYRMFLVLRDAALGNELKTQGKKVIQQAQEQKLPAPAAKQAARGEIPGKKEQGLQSRANSFANLQRSGSIDDAAALFGSLA